MNKLIILFLSVLSGLLIACIDRSMIVVEITPHSTKVGGKQIDDISIIISTFESCGSVKVFITSDVEHQKVVDVMDILKNAKCKNISLQVINKK